MNDLSRKASDDQTRASGPSVSAWVSANAGSGKTHVLVNRVIRLMLTGTPPEKILCLTFTRAAAAEMSNRLYERLAEWIPLDDEALIEKIHLNTGHFKFIKDQLAEPRRLFARALETPGGLKIQTIHAFCDQLLHRFPIEAGITSGFKVMDDRETKELIARVRLRFFNQIDQSLDQRLLGFVAEIIKYSGGQKSFDDLLEKLLNKRSELREVYQDLPGATNRLAIALEIEPSDTRETILARYIQDVDREALSQAQHILQQRKLKTDTDQAIVLVKTLKTENANEKFGHLKSLLLTSAGNQKADTRLCSQACGQENPYVLSTLQTEARRLVQLIDKIKAVDVLKATNALLHMGQKITSQYDTEKNQLGLYDYQDLIEKVLTMFAGMPSAAWVLYKLDGGLDHILVDEAQDTSPAQWDIIQFLADDFFTGAGARSQIKRSIFAVGDRKQSIYSFQGAKPQSFDQRADYFQRAVEQSGQKFEMVDFDVSFRSTVEVLNLVDEVFNQDMAAKGVGKTVHSAQRKIDPGLIEIWPLEEKPENKKSSVWIPQNENIVDGHPRIQLAEKIARKIKSWLETEEFLASENRPIKPGDILILLRRRTQFMNALVRALKQLDIPVAGVDRLKLTEHIGVQDLLALARFVLLPKDDLNFSGLLKSALLEKDDETPFNDDDLIEIATQRGEQSVWRAFLTLVENGAPYQRAKSSLEKWQSRSNRLPPFEFYSSVLNDDKKRMAILTRLGSEAGEPLDAFVAAAQEFEQNNIISLQSFISWIEAGDTEIKREMEKNDDEIRIMTVHGAKGLEANIVILPDTFEVPDAKHTPAIMNCENGTPVWRLKAAFETPLTNALKEQYLVETLEEHNRLLYVAMTRACDRLYIGAAQSNQNLDEKSWYKLIFNTMQKPEHEVNDEVFGSVWRKTNSNEQRNDDEKPVEKESQPLGNLPDWIFSKPISDHQTLNWLAPSKVGVMESEQIEAHLSPAIAMSENRFLRGNFIHKMLQYLPEIPSNRQMPVAKEYLIRHGSGLSEQEQTETLIEIENILTDKRFAAVFAPGSLAEAPVVAKLKLATGKEFMVNGQIDRLCILNNEILILDYKTNRPPPANIKNVNQQYISQLAAYRLTLREIYPKHAIRAGLLWTHNGVLMEIDEARLIAVFGR